MTGYGIISRYVLQPESDVTATDALKGRVPDVTLDCAKYLRDSFNSGKNIVISVELEKPDRVGMIDVAREADYVFYSKLWAEHYGFPNPRDFLEAQIPETRPE